MSEMCNALTRVLDKATASKPRLFAGYVANLDFWLAEVEHRLQVISHFTDRRRNMVKAASDEMRDELSKSWIKSANDPRLRAKHFEVESDWELLQAEGDKLREQVLRSVQRFVKAAHEAGQITDQGVFDIEDRLQVSLRGRRPVAY